MKTILTAFLSVILFTFCQAQSELKEKTEYGSNIITAIPMQIMNNNNDNIYNDNNNGTDVAVGLAYERVLTNQYIGIKLPFSFSLRNPGFYYIMPAIKLYPKKQGAVKYAVGPQFLIATGQIKHRYYTNNYPYNTYTTYSENSTQLGFMINNSLNITVAKQFFIGMDLGIGVQYFDSRDNNDNTDDGYDNPYEPNVQFNFNMGYRF